MTSPSIHLIPLPFFWLLAASFLLALLVYVGARRIFFPAGPNKRSAPEQDRDWSIPSIDADTQKQSPFHNWDPRFKVVSLLIYWFCVASINQLPLCFVALLVALMAVRLAKIPVRTSMKRIAALSGFVGMFLIVMPLTVPAKAGDHLLVVDSFQFLKFNLRGLSLALRIGLKASAIALMMDPVLGTSPFPVTLNALARLKVPGMIVQMISLAHRYIFVFHHEAKRMATGMRARGFQKRTNMETLRTTGNFVGMLFVRSFERTERVYNAMLARGYNGQFHDVADFRAKPNDWLKGGFWVASGLALATSDKLFHLQLPYGL
jgi:cobalt/nickel transport system permease protein